MDDTWSFAFVFSFQVCLQAGLASCQHALCEAVEFTFQCELGQSCNRKIRKGLREVNEQLQKDLSNWRVEIEAQISRVWEQVKEGARNLESILKEMVWRLYNVSSSF